MALWDLMRLLGEIPLHPLQVVFVQTLYPLKPNTLSLR